MPNPVLLVHGLFRGARVFGPMAAYLTAQGWTIYCFDLKLNYGRWGLDRIALQIADYIRLTFPPSQPLDLVGLSMGGLLSRYYVQRLEEIEQVQRLVTISSPHCGTQLAYALPLPLCIQMRPGSVFLRNLNQDTKRLEQLNLTSIWTPYDFIIVPASSSRLGIGEEVKLSVLTHAAMARDRRCFEAVAHSLRTPLKTSS
ncbi:MAG: esterase/lipase family protein [Cyanophyceae cyanobacterium]